MLQTISGFKEPFHISATDGERRLWTAALVLAVRDATAEVDESKPTAARVNKMQAKAWLKSRDGFAIATALGVDPDYWKSWLHKMEAEGWPFIDVKENLKVSG